MYMYVMRDERREKKGRRKQARSNKQEGKATQCTYTVYVRECWECATRCLWYGTLLFVVTSEINMYTVHVYIHVHVHCTCIYTVHVHVHVHCMHLYSVDKNLK